MTMKKALLLAALLATVMMAVAVADKAEDKEPKDKAPKVAEEQNPPARSKRAKEHYEKRAKERMGGNRNMEKAKERMEAYRANPSKKQKSAGLFAALVVPPAELKEVTMPLSEEDQAKFLASREGLLDYVVKESDKYDLDKAETRSTLRDKMKENQAKTRDLLVSAVVNKGYTLQQARMGLILAQFDKLDPQIQQEALAKGKERAARIPPGVRDKAADRQMRRHNSELAELDQLKTAEDRTKWVDTKYKPVREAVPRVLQEPEIK